MIFPADIEWGVIMSKAPYRIIFYQNDDAKGWEFDGEVFETAEAAYDAALEDYQYYAFRVVKLCYPKEN